MKSILRLSLLSLLFLALPAAAQPLMDWNMVGSAGNVDEASVAAATYAFTGLNAHLAAGALGTAVLRYPVTNTWGSHPAGGSTAPPWTTLEIAFIDDGGGVGNQVRVRLMQVNRCTNAEAPIATFYSADGPATTVCSVVGVPAMNFGTNIYYVEVTLARNALANNPSLQYVALY